MGNQLFSCCNPGGSKDRDGNAGYDRLHANGAINTQPPVRGEAGRYRSNATQRPGTTCGGRGQPRSNPWVRTRNVGHGNGSSSGTEAAFGYAQHETAATATATTTTTTSKTPSGRYLQSTGASTSQHNDGNGVRAKGRAPLGGGATAAVNKDTAYGFTGARPHAPGAGNGAAFGHGGIRPGTAGGNARPTGPRIVHAHPNDQRQVTGSGSDPRLGGGRGRTQLGGGMGRGGGGGRFGMAALAATTAGGGAAGRGMSMPKAQQQGGSTGSVLAKYEMKEVLGVGSTSTCYRCVNRSTRKQFACKVRSAGQDWRCVSESWGKEGRQWKLCIPCRTVQCAFSCVCLCCMLRDT